MRSSTGRPGDRCAANLVRVIDFDEPANNDLVAVNQFTVSENRNTRRPDVVLFVNGLPLGVIELKNPTDEDATIWSAWQQLQTYKSELPTLFSMNEALMVSDGNEARVGTLTSGREWYKPWRTVTGETLASPHMTELQVMLEGVFGTGAVPRPHPRLHRVRGRRQRRARQEDGGLSPVPRSASRGRRDPAGRRAAAQGRIAEDGGRYESGGKPGGRAWATVASEWSGTRRGPARA